MRTARLILALLACLALLVSLAPAMPVALQMQVAGAHSCCADDQPDDAPKQAGKCCDGPACVMHCCRVLPASADLATPRFGEARLTLAWALRPPSELRSLAAPEAIFHPPRT